MSTWRLISRGVEISSDGNNYAIYQYEGLSEEQAAFAATLPLGAVSQRRTTRIFKKPDQEEGWEQMEVRYSTNADGEVEPNDTGLLTRRWMLAGGTAQLPMDAHFNSIVLETHAQAYGSWLSKIRTQVDKYLSALDEGTTVPVFDPSPPGGTATADLLEAATYLYDIWRKNQTETFEQSIFSLSKSEEVFIVGGAQQIAMAYTYLDQVLTYAKLFETEPTLSGTAGLLLNLSGLNTPINGPDGQTYYRVYRKKAPSCDQQTGGIFLLTQDYDVLVWGGSSYEKFTYGQPVDV